MKLQILFHRMDGKERYQLENEECIDDTRLIYKRRYDVLYSLIVHVFLFDYAFIYK